MSVATPRVLVVSESRITRRVVEMTFADQPLQLAVFTSGRAAIDDWQTRPPAVLIADLGMNVLGGYVLARELRTQPAGLKVSVILLAGQTDVVDDAATADVRASAVLRKPLDSQQLIDAVRQALRSGPPSVAEVETASADAPPALAADERLAEPPATDAVVAAAGALLLGDDTALEADTTIGAWVADETPIGDAPLAQTLHAALAPELVAAVADRVVREIAPALVERIAHALVREEIARLRGTRVA